MVVLDTSALLAVLLEERGAENVLPHLREAEMSIINVCEVLTKAVEQGGDVEVVERIIGSYDIRVRAFEWRMRRKRLGFARSLSIAGWASGIAPASRRAGSAIGPCSRPIRSGLTSISGSKSA